MACLTPVTIRIDTPIGPLNSAVYEPTRDIIFAVRDNWIMSFDGSTGLKTAESRFVYPGLPGDTYIDYDTTTDSLWATYWRSTPDGNGAEADGKYLAQIDPDDITSAVLHDLNAGSMVIGAFVGFDAGPRQIITRAGIGWMVFSVGTEPPQSRVARINLVTPAVTHTNTISAANSTWGNIGYDGTNIFTLANNPLTAAQLRNPANFALLGTTDEIAARYPYGIASSSVGVNYMCCGSQFIVKATNAGGAGVEIDLGRTNANPHNIRFHIAGNLIYIPLYKDDTVAVLDPLDDSFEIKVGFTAPWDVVFSQTKKFAIEHSVAGLREIT